MLLNGHQDTPEGRYQWLRCETVGRDINQRANCRVGHKSNAKPQTFRKWSWDKLSNLSWCYEVKLFKKVRVLLSYEFICKLFLWGWQLYTEISKEKRCGLRVTVFWIKRGALSSGDLKAWQRSFQLFRTCSRISAGLAMSKKANKIKQTFTVDSVDLSEEHTPLTSINGHWSCDEIPVQTWIHILIHLRWKCRRRGPMPTYHRFITASGVVVVVAVVSVEFMALLLYQRRTRGCNVQTSCNPLSIRFDSILQDFSRFLFKCFWVGKKGELGSVEMYRVTGPVTSQIC